MATKDTITIGDKVAYIGKTSESTPSSGDVGDIIDIVDVGGKNSLKVVMTETGRVYVLPVPDWKEIGDYKSAQIKKWLIISGVIAVLAAGGWFYYLGKEKK